MNNPITITSRALAVALNTRHSNIIDSIDSWRSNRSLASWRKELRFFQDAGQPISQPDLVTIKVNRGDIKGKPNSYNYSVTYPQLVMWLRVYRGGRHAGAAPIIVGNSPEVKETYSLAHIVVTIMTYRKLSPNWMAIANTAKENSEIVIVPANKYAAAVASIFPEAIAKGILKRDGFNYPDDPVAVVVEHQQNIPDKKNNITWPNPDAAVAYEMSTNKTPPASPFITQPAQDVMGIILSRTLYGDVTAFREIDNKGDNAVIKLIVEPMRSYENRLINFNIVIGKYYEYSNGDRVLVDVMDVNISGLCSGHYTRTVNVKMPKDIGNLHIEKVGFIVISSLVAPSNANKTSVERKLIALRVKLINTAISKGIKVNDNLMDDFELDVLAAKNAEHYSNQGDVIVEKIEYETATIAPEAKKSLFSRLMGWFGL